MTRRGRPRAAVDVETARLMLAARQPWREIVSALGVSRQTVLRALAACPKIDADDDNRSANLKVETPR